jgi:hypothetical protein
MSGARRGFTFKTKVGQHAPEAFKVKPEEDLDVKPSKLTNGVKAMFSSSKAVTVKAKPKTIAANPKPAMFESKVPKPAPKPIIEIVPEDDAEAEAEAPTDAPDLDSLADMLDTTHIEEQKDPLGDLREMAELIEAEEKKDLYSTTAPSSYVPETRRGFSEFIKQTYSTFELPEVPVSIEEGDKYPYQKFVRDYMRKESPYRGILVYHGLGSGKTCTSIATAEALYASGKKKIIVMTPASLRKNFLSEVSFCGFRHFQLRNFWVKLDPAEANVVLFANQILGLSGAYLKKARFVWAPDFRKTPEESNYDSLDDEDRLEIRKQIISILDWHPENNPTGRIRFINYNGISAKKLQAMACEKGPERFFDNAVIVIDEIHNLIRFMQGVIDPYLIKLKGFKRLIAPEDVTPGRWKPSLCGQESRLYARGYSFYRLLMDAQNSKLVGLSGTPLINFPEEIGILANVLHGYLPIIEGLIEKVGADAQKQILELGRSLPFTDFVGVKQDLTGGTKVTMTLLPYGVRKIEGGVERIPPEEETPNIDEVMTSIKEAFTTAGMPFRGEVTARSSPLLPPFNDTFANAFIQGDGSGLKNKVVLVTRLNGLISYYKGSRLDLMPRIKIDEVVRVPFSLFAQRAYALKRGEEASREMKPGSETGFTGAWTQVYEVSEKSTSSNYKMGSRQACNFAFPSEVVRPIGSTMETKSEAETGAVSAELVTLAADLMEESTKYKEDMELEPEPDEYIDDEVEEPYEVDEEGQVKPLEGGNPSGSIIDGILNASRLKVVSSAAPDAAQFVVDVLEGNPPEAPVEAPVEAAPAIRQSGTLKAIRDKMLADCKAGRKPDESYIDACFRAKQCLRILLKDKLRLGNLENYSPKFAEMLKRIGSLDGSSLVYSNFLDMEGIGIFRICMEANGYVPIEIIQTANGLAFSKATQISFKKEQPRYLSFTGSEKEDARRMALNLFNAKFSELPQSMNDILTAAGYTDNRKGQLCRVFCITSAGAEGLSLKNVRGVHIMEPHWNEVRLKQVKGRAVRIGSHLELPESDRDVSVFTYISVFGEEAQLARDGDLRIDETIRNVDRVDRKDAVKMGLPIPSTATEYVLTSDERLYVISQKKKRIIDELESAMKSAAVDCELSYKQNKDGTFKCLPLKGAVGDFVYTPDLDEDIAEAAKFSFSEAPVAKVSFQKYKGVVYRIREILVDGAVTGFEMFANADEGLTTVIGTAGVKAGKPAPPVTLN